MPARLAVLGDSFWAVQVIHDHLEIRRKHGQRLLCSLGAVLAVLEGVIVVPVFLLEHRIPFPLSTMHIVFPIPVAPMDPKINGEMAGCLAHRPNYSLLKIILKGGPYSLGCGELAALLFAFESCIKREDSGCMLANLIERIRECWVDHVASTFELFVVL